jgi:hypothetical protein
MLKNSRRQAECACRFLLLVRPLHFLRPVSRKETRTMKKYLFVSLIIGSLALIGCDRTVSSSEKKTTSSDGSSSSVEQKTVQHPDGSVTTEKQTKQKSGQ